MMKRNHVSWTATTGRFSVASFSVTRSATATVRAIVLLARVPLVAAILMLAGVLTAAPFGGAFAQNAPAAGDATPAPAARPGGGLNVLEFKPAMDDLMTMLVQPRSSFNSNPASDGGLQHVPSGPGPRVPEDHRA